MATSSQRRLQPTQVRRFGSGLDALAIPELTHLQTHSYEAFLQEDIPSDKRKNHGLESVFAEIFPIESFDKTVSLEYLRYELGKPRYTHLRMPSTALDLRQATEGLAAPESRITH